ncbi:transposase [Caballeronia sp. J97]|uniref:transposase n=1 Tax=Caballeronia sp. J97 TaxID=2805429 RepID=UPI0039F05571
MTRIGKLELRVPRDRHGEFSTALFERYARSEKALVAALAEMYVQGVSTRKVKAITEELRGRSDSGDQQRADATLAKFVHRPLKEAYPYLIVDACYEKVRESGVIRSQAVLIAIDIHWEGRRLWSWPTAKTSRVGKRSFWRSRSAALSGVEFVASDDHGRSALRATPLAQHAAQKDQLKPPASGFCTI